MIRNTAAATMERVVAATDSPYPASFDGSTIRFQVALFSLMTLSVLYLMISIWMGREIWKGRHDAYPKEPLFAVRAIFLFAAITGFVRTFPEVAYMISYREGSPGLMVFLLGAKRYMDAAAFFPGIVWLSGIWLFYPPICMGLTRLAGVDGEPPAWPTVDRARMRGLVSVVLLVFAISALIAVGKASA